MREILSRPQDAVRAGSSLLAVNGLTRRYGGVTAVEDLTLELAHGECLGVIGPNGAGKSTFIGLIAGAVAPSGGTIVLNGDDVTGMSATGRTRRGIGRTHQIPRPFGRMTVLENLLLAGRHATTGRESVRATTERCLGILERTGLDGERDQLGGGLPLLKRKRLELARALALRPAVLLLDEIGAGLVEHEIAELIDLILRLRREVDGIVVVEHVMDVITACCDRAAVLDFGKLIAEGPTCDVLADEKVAAVYLGTASKPGDAGPVRAKLTPPGPREDPERPLLTVSGVEASYGGVRALRGVDLVVHPGEAVALLGANGAGKTTLANVISGVVRPHAGEVTKEDRRLTGLRPDEITAAGIAHCMEGRRIFATLSVEENLLLAADGVDAPIARERLEHVYELFPVLAERRSGPGTAMSGGQQQMLAIGRALMTAPKLVIFDEISLGLAPVAVDALYEALQKLKSSYTAMLLVEQNLERGLSLADRAYVLAHGRIALSGTPEDIRTHPSLRSLYVGESGIDD
ncbi:ATP-binding cassette domain-containing protein [Streptomyces sp. HNM0645]|uniref:ATP-binding cassette domain-containing protein n=1 Tax=Streptomyces sp. HNM0645 TaxID=2782343 RepID=UPI0024B7D660|nr:ATP-binding cassette domain-containing protein [Streptomyces sp. HNM0645]MDI9888363.1 ATP-binding cassette domain-containing protein [Streptomyces sp. HNM0645]